MPTPAPPHSGPSLHPVRQQLDELDRLLQRMFELPVEPGPEGAEASPLSSATVREERGEEQFPSRSDESAQPSFSPFDFQLSHGAGEKGRQDAGATGRGTGVAPVQSPKSSPELTEEERELSVWLGPLIVLNWPVDRLLCRLGRPGRWLQGTWGRAGVGLIGVLLLAAALVWGILDWLQWNW